jgi:hypothetical protein
LLAGVELRDGHDAVVELESEHRLRDRAHIAHRLFRRLALIGEDVYFDRTTGAIADYPNRKDAAEPAQLVLELAQLVLGISACDWFSSRLAVRPLVRHGDSASPPKPRRPLAPPAHAGTNPNQHTAIPPPSVPIPLPSVGATLHATGSVPLKSVPRKAPATQLDCLRDGERFCSFFSA